MEKINIEEEIEKLKMKKLDFLTKEEVEEILINAREKSFFKKRTAPSRNGSSFIPFRPQIPPARPQ